MNRMYKAPSNSQPLKGVQPYKIYIPIFAAAYLLGSFFPLSWLFRDDFSSSPNPQPSVSRHGTILQLDSVPLSPTSHRNKDGIYILKQQLIEPFAVSQNLAGISIATLQPHQTIEAHAHATMHEFFYVLEGHGTITVNGRLQPARKGTFVHVAPFESHAISATDEKMILMNVGLTTGPK
jgi:quercetin dioxygenase-like cupin family protein